MLRRRLHRRSVIDASARPMYEGYGSAPQPVLRLVFKTSDRLKSLW